MREKIDQNGLKVYAITRQQCRVAWLHETQNISYRRKDAASAGVSGGPGISFLDLLIAVVGEEGVPGVETLVAGSGVDGINAASALFGSLSRPCS